MHDVEEEIPILDLTTDSLKKKKKKGEKKGKSKRDEPDSEEERKAKKKAKKKAEKENLKRAIPESLANTEKWEPAIKARAAGALSSQAPATAKANTTSGEKTVDDAVVGSETQDPQA